MTHKRTTLVELRKKYNLEIDFSEFDYEITDCPRNFEGYCKEIQPWECREVTCRRKLLFKVRELKQNLTNHCQQIK